MRGYSETEAYRKALRKRQVWVEPLFAEAKDRHGLRRFRLRRLEKVNMETLLIAAGQNVKRLLTFGHRHPRKTTQAAALRSPSRPTFYAARARRKGCFRPPRRPVQDLLQQPGKLSGLELERIPNTDSIG